MGKLFNDHLRVLSRSTSEYESFHRSDGTVKYQQGRWLVTHKGRRSIIFFECWYDRREVLTCQRESEFREGVDYEYIRRVHTCDAFGNKTRCREETITLANPRRAEIEARKPTMTADQSLRALLLSYQIDLPHPDDTALPKPPRDHSVKNSS